MSIELTTEEQLILDEIIIPELSAKEATIIRMIIETGDCYHQLTIKTRMSFERICKIEEMIKVRLKSILTDAYIATEEEVEELDWIYWEGIGDIKEYHPAP